MSTLDDQAIRAALSGEWEHAISLNSQILESSPEHIDALNRLAYAMAKCGKFDKACKTYQTILKLDPYNPLAQKNLEKYKQFKASDKKTVPNKDLSRNNKPISPSLFLADAEKTKSVNLINAASKGILQSVSPGQEVYAIPKRFELQIKDEHDTYLGSLPDDIGHPLLKLIKTNNESVRFFVKDVLDNTITVFIKHT